MPSKRKVRQLALQLLFLWDAHGEQDDAMTQQAVAGSGEEAAVRDAAVTLAAAAWEQRGVSDAWVERLAPQWPPRRQPGVDRSIIRLAVWELVGTDTPAKVVIDEAIELAKAYSTENSPAFVNGVLDAVMRERDALTKDALTKDAPTKDQD